MSVLPTVSHAQFSRLERTVLQALATELRGTIPDLAAQIAAAQPGLRRNMAFGFWSGLTVPDPRPATTAYGLYGNVHVMIQGLDQAVAFQVLMRHGQLVALQADAYGQDTRAIDYPGVGFDQVFTLDAQGRSVAVLDAAPAEAMRPSRAPDRPAILATPARAAPGMNTATIFGENGTVLSRPAPALPLTTPVEEPALPAIDDLTLRIGIWVVVAVVAGLSLLLLRQNGGFLAIATFFLARLATSPKGLMTVRRALKAWQDAQAASRA